MSLHAAKLNHSLARHRIRDVQSCVCIIHSIGLNDRDASLEDKDPGIIHLFIIFAYLQIT